MDYLSICRICLSVDSKLRSIIDTHLQTIFETLTLLPLVNEDHRPVHACSECCNRLENSYQLRRSCLRSEELFTQLLSYQVVEQQTTVKSDPDVGAVLPESSELFDSNEVKQEVTEEDPPGDVDSDRECSRLSDEVGAYFEPEIVNTFKVTAHVHSPEREYEVQVIVGPSPCTTHTVEEGIRVHTNDINNVNIEISPNQISSIRNTNSSKVTKKFSCDICQARFASKSQLTIHVRKHTGEKPFTCSDCMKCFRDNSSLMRHSRRTHTGEEPYQCSDCMKCFKEKTSLLKHERSTHTGDKRYKCNYCTKCFNAKSHLKRHLRTHTGEKLHKCSDCMKSFFEKSDLIRHNRIHTGEMPYQCSDCLKCFRYRNSFQQHVCTQHGKLV